jgi:hypothetical protein
VNVTLAPGGPRLRFRPGDRAQFAFTAASGHAPPASFTVSARGAAQVRVRPPDPGQSGASILAGILPYFSYEVLYDSARGVIGLEPRPPA